MAAAAAAGAAAVAPAPAPARHVVALPYPGRGHINPMLLVCRLLVATDEALAVTVVVTEEWHALLASLGVPPTLPERVRFATIPNVIPSERGRGADFVGFLEAVRAKMAEPVERLLDRLMLERKPDAIIVDTFLTWGLAAGARRGIPVCSLWTQPATFFLALYHLDQWPPADGREAEQDNADQRLAHYIYKLASSSIKLSDLEPSIHNKRTVKHILAAISSVKNAQCLLFTTMYELEATVIDSLRSIHSCPVYPIGPCIPYMTHESHHSKSNGEVTSQGDYFTWLDLQPMKSVLYVSLGSFLSVSTSQLDEIALGLSASEVRFLWILRDRSPRVQELIGASSKGMLVPWCEQLKVLSHPSVGGFLTHCGMNSTLEAIFSGVPMLALPLFFDQPIDGRLIVEEWKIGLYVKCCTSKDGLIGRENIARAVKKLMSSDEAETKAIRRRALEWKEATRKAVNLGGSSYHNLSSLMDTVCTSQKVPKSNLGFGF